MKPLTLAIQVPRSAEQYSSHPDLLHHYAQKIYVCVCVYKYIYILIQVLQREKKRSSESESQTAAHQYIITQPLSTLFAPLQLPAKKASLPHHHYDKIWLNLGEVHHLQQKHYLVTTREHHLQGIRVPSGEETSSTDNARFQFCALRGSMQSLVQHDFLLVVVFSCSKHLCQSRLIWS